MGSDFLGFVLLGAVPLAAGSGYDLGGPDPVCWKDVNGAFSNGRLRAAMEGSGRSRMAIAIPHPPHILSGVIVAFVISWVCEARPSLHHG